MTGNPISRIFADARVQQIYDRANEIMKDPDGFLKLLIGRRTLSNRVANGFHRSRTRRWATPAVAEAIAVIGGFRMMSSSSII